MNFFKYSLLRLLLSALAFYAAYYFGAGIYLAIICGFIIGFALCYLLFPKLHVAAAADFNGWFKRRPRDSKLAAEDQDYEDKLDEATRKDS